jgi:glutathione peroxidase
MKSFIYHNPEIRRNVLKLLLTLFFAAALPVQAVESCPEFLNQDLAKLHSNETVNLCDVAARKPLLIINTASHCGYTKQFEGLEALHQKYQDRGLFVVGFASNDFNQEANSEQEAAKVCRLNYGVTFTMVAPSSVKGPSANLIFKVLNKESKEPTWNFNKYLVNANGKVVNYFASDVTPDSDQLNTAIEDIL